MEVVATLVRLGVTDRGGGVGDVWARSSSAGSFEKTSTIGSRSPMRFIVHLRLDHLVPQQEGDDDARLAGARGSSRAVQVGLVVLGRVVVDHHVDGVDVEAARGDVGGDQHGQLAVVKSASALSRWDWRRSPWMAPAFTPSLELLDEPVRAALRPHEQEHFVVGPADRGRHLHLVHLVDWKKWWTISVTVCDRSWTSWNTGSVR